MSFSALIGTRTITVLALGLVVTAGTGPASAAVTDPSYAVSGTSVVEGDAGSTSGTVTVTRSGNTSVATTIGYFTFEGTATKNVDYVHIPSTSTITFGPGETTKTVTVQVKGDSVDESDE